MHELNKKTIYPNQLFSPYYRAARGVYQTFLREPNQPRRAMQACERLKGIHGALKYALMQSEGSEHAKLLHDYRLIGDWIDELYRMSKKPLKISHSMRGGENEHERISRSATTYSDNFYNRA